MNPQRQAQIEEMFDTVPVAQFASERRLRDELRTAQIALGRVQIERNKLEAENTALVSIVKQAARLLTAWRNPGYEDRHYFSKRFPFLDSFAGAGASNTAASEPSPRQPSVVQEDSRGPVQVASTSP